LLPLRALAISAPDSGGSAGAYRSSDTGDDSCEDWGAIPPTCQSLATPDRLPAVPFGRSGLSRCPANRGNVRLSLQCSQALKTQHIVVSCLPQPPHVGYVGGNVEISPSAVHRRRTACGRPVETSRDFKSIRSAPRSRGRRSVLSFARAFYYTLAVERCGARAPRTARAAPRVPRPSVLRMRPPPRLVVWRRR
jgi:hypothetical protein